MNKVFDNFEWKNAPDQSTPINAQNLNKINNAVDTIDDRVVDLNSEAVREIKVSSLPTSNIKAYPTRYLLKPETGKVWTLHEYYDGDWIQIGGAASSEPSIPEPEGIVSFSDGRSEQIIDMINRHYAGEIDISDYWSVGDERVINLRSMSTSYVNEAHVAQAITLVIIGIEHDTLYDEPSKKACITVQTKEVLGNDGEAETGIMHTSVSLSGAWGSCNRKKWCSNVFKQALPEVFSENIKEVKKYYAIGSNIYSGKNDVFFLPSANVFSEYKNNYETVYPYFLDESNVIKKVNNNGSTSSLKCGWWLTDRTGGTITSASTHTFYYVLDTGTRGNAGATYETGLAPAFCL